MASWGKTDTAASAPKWLETNAYNTNKSHDKDNVVFVDTAEMSVASNRAKGLKGPGWWLYYADGVRHHAECLVPMKVGSGPAGDLGVTGSNAQEDTIVADV